MRYEEVAQESKISCLCTRTDAQEKNFPQEKMPHEGDALLLIYLYPLAVICWPGSGPLLQFSINRRTIAGGRRKYRHGRVGLQDVDWKEWKQG